MGYDMGYRFRTIDTHAWHGHWKNCYALQAECHMRDSRQKTVLSLEMPVGLLSIIMPENTKSGTIFRLPDVVTSSNAKREAYLFYFIKKKQITLFQWLSQQLGQSTPLFENEVKEPTDFITILRPVYKDRPLPPLNHMTGTLPGARGEEDY